MYAPHTPTPHTPAHKQPPLYFPRCWCCRYHKGGPAFAKGTKDMSVAEKISTLSARLKEKGAEFAGLAPTSAEVPCLHLNRLRHMRRLCVLGPCCRPLCTTQDLCT